MAVHHNRPHDDSVLEAERVDVKPPPMYRVLLLNDDYTPMDFVVGVLQQVFAMTREQATRHVAGASFGHGHLWCLYEGSGGHQSGPGGRSRVATPTSASVYDGA